MKGLLTRTDRFNESTASQRSKTSKGNMQLHIRMFLLMAALFAILYGVLTIAGHFMGITSGWYYLLITLAIMGLEYLIGPMLIGAVMKVKWVSEQEEPDLHRMVAELARAAHLPKPRVGISRISVPNAFAYGRSQKDGRICVTQGIRELLNADELRAVLGHEMSHLRNRDMAVITILSAIPMVLYNIVLGMMPSNHGDSDNDSSESALFVLAILIVYYVTELLVLYGSRIREYYADRGSVRLGNEPHYLAAALYKLTTIDTQAKTTPDLQRIEGARAFLFSNPSPSRREIGKLVQIDLGMKGMIDAEGLRQLRQKPIKLSLRDNLIEAFNTHPNMLKRIKALSELDSQCDLLPKNWTKLSGKVNHI